MKDALQKLDDAGHLAYVVGGSVRDFLLGREAKDHDIATSAEPDVLCELFPDAVTVGKAFGVLKVPIPGESELLEIATFREDLEYRDHRHPTGILLAGPTEDARRRDFTVNALFYDPKASRILDTVGGVEDLKAKTLRAIGNPMARFREDALRLLRAVRFATTLGFRIEPETLEAIRARHRLIAKVSAERVREELTLMLKGPAPGAAIRMLSELGLLADVLPEVEALKGPPHPEGSWERVLKTLDLLARGPAKTPRSSPLAWAALLHENGPKVAKTVCERMRLSRGDCDAVSTLVEEQPKMRGVFKMREATLQRFIRQERFAELLALHRAVAIATDGNLAFHEFCSSRHEEVLSAPAGTGGKLVTGEDLIQLGLSPGPRFSEILRSIEDLALEKKLHSKEEALEYVVKHFVR